MKNKIVKLVVDIPESTRKALKIKAAQEDRSMQDIVFNLIIEYIKRKEGEQ